jgi:hypothetical protein
MPAPDLQTPRLVSAPREQYLRKEETRIRSAAIAMLAAGPSPDIRAALDAVLHAEDLYDIHDETAKFYQQRSQPVRVETHTRYASQAMQLKLRSLDQLSFLVL